jgi:beta-galactosidase
MSAVVPVCTVYSHGAATLSTLAIILRCCQIRAQSHRSIIDACNPGARFCCGECRHFGVIDIAGFPKDDYWYYRSWWRNDPTVLHILPQDWNAPVPVGSPLDAVVYSAAAEVELSVNGVSLGRQPVPPYGVVRYPNITFQPGSLTATSWDAAGKQVASAKVVTSKPTARLILTADAGPILRADNQDVALVRVTAVDSEGTFVPSASSLVAFKINGPGTVYGVANGDPTDHGADKDSARKLFKGLARVLVKSTGQPGTITVVATSGTLPPATLTLTSE